MLNVCAWKQRKQAKESYNYALLVSSRHERTDRQTHLIHMLTQTTKTQAGCVCMEMTPQKT